MIDGIKCEIRFKKTNTVRQVPCSMQLGHSRFWPVNSKCYDAFRSLTWELCKAHYYVERHIIALQPLSQGSSREIES